MTAAVAVTGASGFVGQAILGHLLALGWPVRALVHRQPLAIRHPALTTVSGGLSDAGALRRLMDGAGCVIHVAGRVRGRDADDFMPVNADGVARVAHLAQEAATVSRLVLISSLAAREPGLSPYAASKRAGEDRLAGVSGAGGLSCAVLRPPAIYGPGDRELVPLLRLMARGIAPMPGVAGARASLLHVDDLARAAARLLDSPAEGVYELGDGHDGGYGWDEIATIAGQAAGRRRGGVRVRLPRGLMRGVAGLNLAVARALGTLPMLSPGKVNELFHPDWVCDNTAMTRATGWQPEISLHDGLAPLFGGRTVRTREGRSNVT